MCVYVTVFNVKYHYFQFEFTLLLWLERSPFGFSFDGNFVSVQVAVHVLLRSLIRKITNKLFFLLSTQQMWHASFAE